MAAVVLGLLEHGLVGGSVDGVVRVALVLRAGRYLLVAIALVEVEAVQVVGHFAVVEGKVGLSLCHAMIGGIGLIGLAFLVIAVDNLYRLFAGTSGRLAEDGIDAAVGSACGVDPAVLDIAVAGIHDSGTGELTGHAEVIDLAAELAEERVVEAAEGMAVAVEGALEAGFFFVYLGGSRIVLSGDGRPRRRAVVDVGAQEELKMLAGCHVRVHRLMSGECGMAGDAAIAVEGRTGKHAQVVEVLQEVESVLRAAAVVVDVDLRLYLQTVEYLLVVDIVVVVLVVHHLLQVVVVGHADRHVVGVGLAQGSLGVVGQVVLVLIEIERVGDGCVVHAVHVALGIGLAVEELPAGTGNLVGSGSDIRFGDGDGGTWQDDFRCLDVLHGGYAALEAQVDVQHMALADRRDVHTGHVALHVVVLIDDGDNLLG